MVTMGWESGAVLVVSMGRGGLSGRNEVDGEGEVYYEEGL